VSKVFVIQDNRTLNLSDAKRYGELVTLIERDVFPDDAEERIEAIHNIMDAKFRNFNPLHDFVLLVGAPEAIAMAFLILGSQHDTIKTLKWDRENRGYYPITLKD